MYIDNNIWIANEIGNNFNKINIIPKMLNRHGLIAGATGTGKTITLKVLAESFSDAGIPVVLADVKGDLSGMIKEGSITDKLKDRLNMLGINENEFIFKAYPTEYWDIRGKKGLNLRTTISEFGYLLLARLLDLNQIQTEILSIVFKIADEENLLLIDIKDLKAMLNYISDNTNLYKENYGNISKQSIGAIIRALVSFEDRGGKEFFLEPALDIYDWFRYDNIGRGYINIIDSSSLMTDSLLYSTFMLFMLAELFENLPEVGDLDKPKMVFFFDEAHLLFESASKVLLKKIEQVVKLIRSKGIGIFFITQNPNDIPDEILAQLGNKIQHALRAYSVNEQKAIKAVAKSYRVDGSIDIEKKLPNLGIGEAIVSFIDEEGVPSVAKQVNILIPQSHIGILEDSYVNVNKSNLYNKYNDVFDRDSAYEFLLRKKGKENFEIENSKKNNKEEEKIKTEFTKNINSVGKSAAGTLGREIGNTIGKSIGGSFGKKLGGNIGASLGRGLLETLFKIKF